MSLMSGSVYSALIHFTPDSDQIVDIAEGPRGPKLRTLAPVRAAPFSAVLDLLAPKAKYSNVS